MRRELKNNFLDFNLDECGEMELEIKIVNRRRVVSCVCVCVVWFGGRRGRREGRI